MKSNQINLKSKNCNDESNQLVEFCHLNKNYILLINFQNNNINLKLRDISDLKIWEAVIDYDLFQKQYPFIFFELDTFIEFIISSIKDNSFNLIFDYSDINLYFKIKFGSGNFSQIKPFTITLNSTISSQEANCANCDVSSLSSTIKNLKLEFDNYKIKNEKNIFDLQNDKSLLESKIYDLTREIKLLKNKFENLHISEKLTNDELIKSKDNYILANTKSKNNDSNIPANTSSKKKTNSALEVLVMENKLINEAFKITDDKAKAITKSNKNNKSHLEFFIQNIQAINFSNQNKTISKDGDNRVGVRCHEIPSHVGEYTFNIRVDKTFKAKILVGFCLSNHDGSKGFIESNCIIGLNLKNGYVYCPSTGNLEANYKKGYSGMTLAIKINTSTNIVSFIGDPFTLTKKFQLENKEKKKICFCVSLSDNLDTVTILN